MADLSRYGGNPLAPEQAPIVIRNLIEVCVGAGLFYGREIPEHADLTKEATEVRWGLLQEVYQLAQLHYWQLRKASLERRRAEPVLVGDGDLDAAELPEGRLPERVRSLRPTCAAEILPLVQAVTLAAVEDAMGHKPDERGAS